MSVSSASHHSDSNGESLQPILDRVAGLEGDGDKFEALDRLFVMLDPKDPSANYARGSQVLDHSAAMGVVLSTATAGSGETAMHVLWMLYRLTIAGDNATRLFQEYPSVAQVLVGKLQSGAELEDVESGSLDVLERLAHNDEGARKLFAEHGAKLVPLLLARTGDSTRSERVRVGALKVLTNLAMYADNRRAMAATYPDLVPLLPRLLCEAKSEREQVQALLALQSLAFNNPANARAMVKGNAGLVPQLVAKLGPSSSLAVQHQALLVLASLAVSQDNAREMTSAHAVELLSLLVANMAGDNQLPAALLAYHLSFPLATRAALSGNGALVAALTKAKRETTSATALLSFLALVNLFGDAGDADVLITDAAMLKQVYALIGHAMNRTQQHGWWQQLNEPLVALQLVCQVAYNRQTLWHTYHGEFLSTVLDALECAIGTKEDPDAVDNAVLVLARFSLDAQPLAWMRSNKLRLDQAFAKLMGQFPKTLRTAELLYLLVSPPKILDLPLTTVLISHHHEQQVEAQAVHSVAQQLGYPVWREKEEDGDPTAKLVDAMNRAGVVLMLVSKSYLASAYCGMECQFARNCNRKLVAVMVGPAGCDLHEPGAYYDAVGLSTPEQMEPVIRKLLETELPRTPEKKAVAAPAVAAPAPAVVAAVDAPKPAPPKTPSGLSGPGTAALAAGALAVVAAAAMGVLATTLAAAAICIAVAVAVVVFPITSTSTSTPKQPVPQNEQELRAWLAANGHEGGDLADKLIGQGLATGKLLQALAQKSAGEIKLLAELTGAQALELEAKLKALF